MRQIRIRNTYAFILNLYFIRSYQDGYLWRFRIFDCITYQIPHGNEQKTFVCQDIEIGFNLDLYLTTCKLLHKQSHVHPVRQGVIQLF